MDLESESESVPESVSFNVNKPLQVFVAVAENPADGRAARHVPGSGEGSAHNQGVHSAAVLPGRQGGRVHGLL